MRIVRLTASNIKRLRAVEITPDGNTVVIAGANGAGKAQPLSEPVLTPDGWKPMGEVKPGAQVIGSAGVGVDVTDVFPQAGREVWEVRFADGSAARCSPDHLWTVSAWQSSTWTRRRMTTAEIVQEGLTHRGHARRWAVPLMAPVERERLPLPIDPYALGVILGDGHISSTGYVQVSTDTEILDALGVEGYRRPSRGCEVLGSGEWAFRLEDLGLCGRKSNAKFVPAMYLAASVEQRQSLLAGLLDTDGTALSAGSSEFGSTSEALADAVVDLVRGLGGLAKKSGPQFKHYTYKGEKRRSALGFWTVLVRTERNPFRLARKADRWTAPTSRRPVRRFIDAIERVEDEATQCILVDSPDQLYVTKDYVLTHNSSVLDAIWFALGGGPATKDTARPIRDGETTASVTLDLGELTVTRTWQGEKTTLRVESADGARYSSPQAMLDGLVGRLSFDPLAFANLPEREQLATLLGLVDLPFDPAALDSQRKALYEDRTAVGRDGAALKGRLTGLPVPPADLPSEETAAAGLMAEYRQAQDRHRQHEDRRIAVLAAEAKVERLRDGLAAAQLELDALHEPRDSGGLPDLAAIEARMESVEETNSQIRAARERAKVAAEYDAAGDAYRSLTEQIDALDKRKATAIRNAAMPIDGLAFDATGVTYAGIPFRQCSSAEQLRVSVAMAMAVNPTIRVIRITDGSLLDAQSMALIAEMAAEADYQCWIERVSDSGDVGIVIEDGAVVSTPSSRTSQAVSS